MGTDKELNEAVNKLNDEIRWLNQEINKLVRENKELKIDLAGKESLIQALNEDIYFYKFRQNEISI